MANDKGLLFFYDWKPAFEALSGDDCKALLLAMLDYRREGIPPPEFEGGAKIAAAFIFPAIDRSIKLSSAGRKGGINSQQAQSGLEAGLKGASKGNSSTKQNKTKTKNNTITECGLVVERGEPEVPERPPAHTQGEGFIPPSPEEVSAYFREIRSASDAQAFHAHYASNGWTVNGIPMHDWKAKAQQWDRQDREKGKTTRPENVPGYTPPCNPLDTITFDD